MGSVVATAATVGGLALQGYSMVRSGKKQQEESDANYEYRVAKGEAEATSVEQAAEAESEGYQHSADAAERAAKVARIQSDEISASYRADLSTTIANIRAIRASTGASAASPSTRAYIDSQEKTAELARKIKSGGARMQAAQSDIDALFYRTSARKALARGKKTAASIRDASTKGGKSTGYDTAGIISGSSYFLQAAGKVAENYG